MRSSKKYFHGTYDPEEGLLLEARLPKARETLMESLTKDVKLSPPKNTKQKAFDSNDIDQCLFIPVTVNYKAEQEPP